VKLGMLEMIGNDWKSQELTWRVKESVWALEVVVCTGFPHAVVLVEVS
jgi:hypothetical protein